MKAKKRWLSLLGAAIMALTVAAVPAKAAGITATANTSNVSAKIGDTITVPVTFTTSEKVQGFGGNVVYDDAVLKFTGVEFSVSGMKSVVGKNFNYMVGATDAFKEGTINLKFEVLKCAATAPTVAANIHFATESAQSADSQVTSTVTVAHPADKQTTEVTTPATCTTKGVKTTKCGVCGAVIKTEEIATVPHKWVAGDVIKEATCQAEGEQEYKCEVGGETKTEKIAKKAHKWVAGDVIKEATCKEEGEQEYKCEVGGETKTEKIAKKAHEWIVNDDTDKDGWKVITEATKDKEGKKERECKICGEKETKTIAKLSDAKKDDTKKNTTKANGTTNNGKKATTVKTGDNLVTMYVMIAVALAAAVIAVLMLKRRKEQ